MHIVDYGGCEGGESTFGGPQVVKTVFSSNSGSFVVCSGCFDPRRGFFMILSLCSLDKHLGGEGNWGFWGGV